jgi:hypothetical protein
LVAWECARFEISINIFAVSAAFSPDFALSKYKPARLIQRVGFSGAHAALAALVRIGEAGWRQAVYTERMSASQKIITGLS